MDAATPPLRVLCVDDNHDSADSMAMLLDMLGCEVEVSYGGAAALTLAEEFRPDVCLLDLTMPGMDGLELAQRLRQCAAGRRMLVVAMTALGSEVAPPADDRCRVRPSPGQADRDRRADRRPAAVRRRQPTAPDTGLPADRVVGLTRRSGRRC